MSMMHVYYLCMYVCIYACMYIWFMRIHRISIFRSVARVFYGSNNPNSEAYVCTVFLRLLFGIRVRP